MQWCRTSSISGSGRRRRCYKPPPDSHLLFFSISLSICVQNCICICIWRRLYYNWREFSISKNLVRISNHKKSFFVLPHLLFFLYFNMNLCLHLCSEFFCKNPFYYEFVFRIVFVCCICICIWRWLYYNWREFSISKNLVRISNHKKSFFVLPHLLFFLYFNMNLCLHLCSEFFCKNPFYYEFVFRIVFVCCIWRRPCILNVCFCILAVAKIQSCKFMITRKTQTPQIVPRLEIVD